MNSKMISQLKKLFVKLFPPRSFLRSIGIALLFFVLVLGVNISQAELGPKETVEKLIVDLKGANTLAVIVDYVDWDAAFSSVPPQNRAQLKLASPEDYKAMIKNMLSKPGEEIQKQMDEQFKTYLATLPKDKQEMYRAQLDKMKESSAQKFEEQRQKIKDTKFTVGKEKITGDTAEVEVVREIGGIKENEMVKLQKVNDKWFLSSMALVNQKQSDAAVKK